MRIGIFTPTFLPKFSGAEIFHHQLAQRLQELGNEVVVFMPNKQKENLARQQWKLGYQIDGFPGNLGSLIKRWPQLGLRFGAFFLDKLQRKWNLDVWHGLMMLPCGVTLVHWANQRNIPHVIRSAGSDILLSKEGNLGERLNLKMDKLIRDKIPHAQRVIALSESIREEFQKVGVAREKILLIPNAVDTSKFGEVTSKQKQELRKNLGLRAEAFTFLAVGRNHPQKNYPCLLEAAKILSIKSRRDWQILIAGRDVQELERTSIQMGLQGRVIAREFPILAAAGMNPTFPPKELVNAYLAADVFVMASHLEGFSTAMVEAMAAGLPIITTSSPGCRELVSHGKEGWLVNPCDAESLAN
ncbi:MAG: glycosyltransferase family 4 protein, partial [Chthoniobacterales bacterium]|nr:glycosyltransferase family 4 protein [Chthoniobacterales bacterium]